jgi:hypothetical protein
MIYCLGDLVGYNIWPNEVITDIRARQIPTIAAMMILALKKVRHQMNMPECFEKDFKIKGYGNN